MRPTPSRTAALDVLRALRRGDLADRAFAHVVETLPPRERPWLHELLYGTLRLRGRLDHILARLVKRGLDSLEPDVLDILRLGAYQLLEMNSVPPYAAVSQSVELAKTLRSRGASGLVNGVLQSLRRALPVEPPAQLASLDDLAGWGSHPRWLVERWAARFGIAETASLLAANNLRPDLYVRPIGLDPEATITAAAAADVALGRVTGAPDALRVRSGSVQQLLAAVPVIVQDPAAGLVVRYSAIEHGVVADLCAAPGGKALALADTVGERGVVVASDVSPGRMTRLLENARRLSAGLGIMVADARHPPLESADAVLIDAPCTGTGTLRRHPDGKWRITHAALAALVQLQREILDAASALVKPGGVLVYATCSLEPEENQEQVTDFLKRHPNFERRPPAGWARPELLDADGSLVVLPQHSGFDGAFAARLARAS